MLRVCVERRERVCVCVGGEICVCACLCVGGCVCGRGDMCV